MVSRALATNSKARASLLLILFVILFVLLIIVVLLFSPRSPPLTGSTTADIRAPPQGNPPPIISPPAKSAQDAQANGAIKVFMCATHSCEDELAQFMRQANSTLDCALYDVTATVVLAALNHSNAQVRLVMDSDEINKNNNFSFTHPADNTAIMHNKFCISDGSKVFTGSYNPTKNKGDDNNIVILDSAELAKNYAAEFEELWADKKNVPNARSKFVIGGIAVENYFCPDDDCSGHLIQELRKANHTIYFMTYSFTHPEVGTDIVLRHYAGIDVRGVFERSQKSNYSRYFLFDVQNISVRWDGNKGLMHHKVFIIDNRTVVTGSFNPSNNADQRNDENVLVIHDETIAQQYAKEFQIVWAQAEKSGANAAPPEASPSESE